MEVLKLKETDLSIRDITAWDIYNVWALNGEYRSER
jgi:hypothetical protein